MESTTLISLVGEGGELLGVGVIAAGMLAVNNARKLIHPTFQN